MSVNPAVLPSEKRASTNDAPWLFDVTGSYRLAFLAAAVAIAGSSVAAWLAARPHSPPTRPRFP